MNIDTKRIGQFLKSVDGVDFRYLENTISVRRSLTNLIERHSLTKEDVCRLFDIKPGRYNNFIKGNYNYTLHDLVRIDSVYAELEKKKKQEQDAGSMLTDELIWKIIEVTAHEYGGEVWGDDTIIGTKAEIINKIRNILDGNDCHGDIDADDDFEDADLYEQEEELPDHVLECTCGAYRIGKSGEVITVADCCCGAV